MGITLNPEEGRHGSRPTGASGWCMIRIPAYRSLRMVHVQEFHVLSLCDPPWIQLGMLLNMYNHLWFLETLGHFYKLLRDLARNCNVMTQRTNSNDPIAVQNVSDSKTWSASRNICSCQAWKNLDSRFTLSVPDRLKDPGRVTQLLRASQSPINKMRRENQIISMLVSLSGSWGP